LCYAPFYLYMLPGFFFTFLGLLLMAFTYFEVYLGYTPGLHTMVLGSFGVLVGSQLIFTGLFARAYGFRTKMRSMEKLMAVFINHMNLERGALVGGVLFLAGFAYLVHLFLKWFFSGFMVLPLKGQDVVAFTLMFLGLQVFFNSFYLSMIVGKLSY
ncbi:MAG: hypothetical protein N3E48_05475, partial [Candidatus Bathyarchaeota archaeon]|nr:hypothetical protein [Candidatus Bathyarchaeota archaeon]